MPKYEKQVTFKEDKEVSDDIAIDCLKKLMYNRTKSFQENLTLALRLSALSVPVLDCSEIQLPFQRQHWPNTYS